MGEPERLPPRGGARAPAAVAGETRQRARGDREGAPAAVLDSLAAGGNTPRMDRAVELLQHYRAVERGRWLPHAEAAVVAGTALDGGHAMTWRPRRRRPPSSARYSR